MKYYKHRSADEYYRVHPDGTYEFLYIRNDGARVGWQPGLKMTLEDEAPLWKDRWPSLDVPVFEIAAVDMFQLFL